MAIRKKAATNPEAAEAGGFRGFGSQALPFLEQLREHNDREWFAENKATFLEECDAPLRELVAEVGQRLASSGLPLAPIARNPVFRIYRDVRFSHDKSPYKTNIGAALYREGDKARPGLLYLHVEPGRSFLAAGFYHPDPVLLKALRDRLAEDPTGFEKVIRSLEGAGLKLDDGEPLTRMPKGFEAYADSTIAGALRARSIITDRPLADEDLESRDLPESVARFTTQALPLLEFFWKPANAGG